jgi:hypothetical protein
VIISATLSAFILTGVLSAFLMMGRGGFLANAYTELDAETRRGLEVFGADAREARDIQWSNSQSVTLSVVSGGSTVSQVTYAYDSDSGSPTYQCFYRVLGNATSTLPRRVLVHHVASDFAFQRFKLVQPGVVDNSASSDSETKQLQVTFRALRVGSNAPTATQSAISASYILRNKRVAN